MDPNSDGKPPPHTIVISSAGLSRVDVGLAVAAVARELWTEIEERAGFVIELDAWGAVLGDDGLLQKLLGNIMRGVLRGIPPGTPANHSIGLRAQAGPDETLLLDVQHTQHAGPPTPPIDATEVAAWNRQAIQFTARVEQVAEPRAASCFRIALRLAQQ